MTLDGSYFDDLYGRHADPWGFRTRWYETRKRRLTMAALPDERYGSVFEPGCSIGILSAELAARADHLLAMDVSVHPLRQAGGHQLPNVELRQGSVPEDWPAGRFDLVVLSEIGYYLDSDDCRRLADLTLTTARDVVAVHWRHLVDDYPLTGDEVHGVIRSRAEALGRVCLCSHIEEDFRLDVWSIDDRSVARRSGLLGS